MQRSPVQRRLRSTALGVLVLVALGILSSAAEAQTLSSDPFVAQVRGDWQGSGEYEGNPLALTRSWQLVLNDQFLHADMRVSMSNGVSFGAVMYWRHALSNSYDVVWLDGSGRRQLLRATRDPESGLVSATFLDNFAEGGPEQRTWEFESLGPDAYVERLYRVVAGGREELAVFSFRRVSGG